MGATGWTSAARLAVIDLGWTGALRGCGCGLGSTLCAAGCGLGFGARAGLGGGGIRGATVLGAAFTVSSTIRMGGSGAGGEGRCIHQEIAARTTASRSSASTAACGQRPASPGPDIGGCTFCITTLTGAVPRSLAGPIPVQRWSGYPGRCWKRLDHTSPRTRTDRLKPGCGTRAPAPPRRSRSETDAFGQHSMRVLARHRCAAGLHRTWCAVCKGQQTNRASARVRSIRPRCGILPPRTCFSGDAAGPWYRSMPDHRPGRCGSI